MKTVIIYTDGACSGNPGPGGWGAILDDMGIKTELSGGEANTTNNRMELTAVIEALKALSGSHSVELFSDSKYVIDALKLGWAASWRSKGWRKGDGKPAQNADLWEVLLDLVAQHKMTYHWVKGHADNPMNNRCDEMAVAEWQRIKSQSESKPVAEQPAAAKPDVHYEDTLVKTVTVTQQVKLDDNDIFNWLCQCQNPETLKYLGRAALRFAHNLVHGNNDVDPLS